MDITVYLPEEIGAKAKEADLPFSRLLRGAVEEELEQLACMEQAMKSVRVHKLELTDQHGREYIGQFTGKLIVEDEGDREVYLTEDGRTLLYDPMKMELDEIEDPQEELRNWLREDAYMEAGEMLGFKPIIQL